MLVLLITLICQSFIRYEELDSPQFYRLAFPLGILPIKLHPPSILLGKRITLPRLLLLHWSCFTNSFIFSSYKNPHYMIKCLEVNRTRSACLSLFSYILTDIPLASLEYERAENIYAQVRNWGYNIINASWFW